MVNDKNERRDRNVDRKTVSIRRVAKVTQGGKRLRFSAMVIAGDKNGSVGVGLGRGVDTRAAVEKGSAKAEKNMKKIELIGDTIPHEIEIKYGACRVILRPARPGTGVIAGSAARIVLELAGIENVYAKQLGSNDPIGNAYCVYKALTSLRKARVLNRMHNMKSRIEYKTQLDKERKEKENKQRKEKFKMMKETKGFDRSKRFQQRTNRRPQNRNEVKSSPLKKDGPTDVPSKEKIDEAKKSE